MKQIDKLVAICVQKGYVSQDTAPWLKYALERRIVSLIAFIPLLMIGFLIVSPATVLAFFVTFCLLRSRTNGFHAKTVGRCLLYSMIGEIFFLGVLPMVWNDVIACVTLAVSIILIWFLAPYNHPNMDLSLEEIAACAKSAKWRLCILLLVMIMFHVCEQSDFVTGIAIGIVMTASTLVIAYCSSIVIPEEKVKTR